jgi:starvation-inducible DNA-binding protein
MHPTRHDLKLSTRQRVIAVLDPLLAASIDLMMQAKHAHWNVRGPSFMPLHELFDKLSQQAQEHADELAERIAALGGTPPGTVRSVAARSPLREYPLTAVDGPAHLKALASVLAAHAGNTRQAIDACAALNDQGSADLCTSMSREIDQQLWFIEAHVQAKR